MTKYLIILICSSLLEEEFEDIKGVIRIHKSEEASESRVNLDTNLSLTRATQSVAYPLA